MKNILIGIVAVALGLGGYFLGKQKAQPGDQASKTVATQTTQAVQTATNPVVYFEIPVLDPERAMQFYQAVFRFDFSREEIDHNDMCLFPLVNGAAGITGALAKGDTYKPAQTGTLVYFHTDDIDATLAKAVKNGGRIFYPKTDNGDLGSVAEFIDSEGNRVALHQPKP